MAQPLNPALEEVPWDELAFWSTGVALRDFLAMDAGSGARPS